MTASELRAKEDARLLAPQFTTLPLSDMSSGDRRLEAEVYLSDGFTVRRLIQQSSLQPQALGEIGKIWQPSRLKGVQVGPEHGVPFVAATQVFDIWPTPRKWLAPSRTPDLAQRYVAPDWMLVTCSGSVGNVIMTYSTHANLVISHDLLRVEIDDPQLRSYVYAFLRTRFGRTMMQASHYGNVIKHLEVAHLEQVLVPVLPLLLSETERRIRMVFDARDEAYRLDMASRHRFDEAMDDRPEPPSEEGYAVSALEMFGGRRRLEAYAHSPASQFVSRVFERNAVSIESLGSLARAFIPGRFKRIYGDVGTPYLDSEPVFKINPERTKFLTPATDINFATYMVKRGWLLMARSGQIYGINGQAIIANECHEQKVVTEHIMRIVPEFDKIRPGYLQTVLSHPTLGKPLVVSRAYGTSVPELAPEDIERLPIPRLARQVEHEIANAAERASELRVKADKEENGAVSKLEAELEKELGIAPDKEPRHVLTRLNAATPSGAKRPSKSFPSEAKTGSPACSVVRC